MADYALNIPAATVGQPYLECVQLQGRPTSILSSVLPAGFTAEIVGNSLCIKSEKVPAFTTADVIIVVAGSCDTCDPANFVGVLTVATPAATCPCTPIGPITAPTLPAVIHYGDRLDYVIPLTGSGPFEFCAGSKIPNCLDVEIIGSKVVISGVIKETGVLAFSITNGCNCGCQEVVLPIALTPLPCIDVQITNQHITVAGTLRTYTITGVAGCEVDYVVSGTVNDVAINYGSSFVIPTTGVYSFSDDPGANAAGTVGDVGITFRPRKNCGDASMCRSTFRLTDNIPGTNAPCVVSWGISTTSFIAGTDTPLAYTSSGIPAGCSLRLIAFDGNTPLIINGSQANVTLTSDAPAFASTNNWPASYVAHPINWRPDPVQQSCMTCAVQPAQIDLTISAAAPVPPTEGCPALANDFSPLPVGYYCGGTQIVDIVAGTSYTVTRNFTGTSAVTVAGNPAGTTSTTSAGSATVSGTWPAGNHYVTFTGTNAGCANCVSTVLIRSGTGGTPSPAPSPTTPTPPPPGPPPPPAQSFCNPGEYQLLTCANVQSGQTCPVIWKNPGNTNFSIFQSTLLTSSNPTVSRIVIPFTVLPSTTTAGGQLASIDVVEISGGARTFSSLSVSRNQCDFTPVAGVTFVQPYGSANSMSFSLNDPSGGGFGNLTSGQWYVTVDVQLPSGTYDANKLISFTLF
jgi:hypothetical protein